jgi:signal transduction histidine kinase/CheY-like chemotaxis protein
VTRDLTDRRLAEAQLARTPEREAEQALRESEQRIRVKLDCVLSPEGDLGTLELADIIDAQALHAMMDEFNKLARIPLAIIDVKGNVLIGVGWQDICTRFHRVHPETCRHCVESDTQLAAASPGQVKLYKCKNNMWDIATPIAVGGQHLGNVFMGQFFFADEAVDEDLFRSQARRYGFDEEEYLGALAAVPRLSRDSVDAAMSFFLKFADMLSNLSFSNIKLARSSSEREALMKSLQDNKERLEESDRRKTDFLAVLSHELRNPLAPIRNSIHLLDRAAPDSEQAARSREVIRRQSGQLSRLVDDLLDVTRISRGKIVLRPTRVDARELVQRACDDHRSLFHGRGIELRVETSDPTWIEVDETRMAQVVGNLLQNAAKFSDVGGAVTASVCIAGGHAEIRVRDEGVGITPELLPLVFEPFVQADGGLARTKGGLGLGLALVKGLVELQGGSVRAYSNGERRGAEFVVSLPLVAAPQLPAPAPLPAVVARPMEILVIEDNVDAAQSLAEVLEMEGHRVHVANDGRSGIAKARELKPDVVLCDIGLPDVDGYEIARMLRVEGELRSMRLIALSGYAQPEDRQRAADAGFDAHIPKPPALRTLFQLLSGGEEL